MWAAIVMQHIQQFVFIVCKIQSEICWSYASLYRLFIQMLMIRVSRSHFDR